MAGPVGKMLRRALRNEAEPMEFALAPTTVYQWAGPMVFAYPVALWELVTGGSPVWLLAGGLVVTAAVAYDTYTLSKDRPTDWRFRAVYPPLFAVGFVVYPLLVPLYLYHRRRAAGAAVGTDHDAVEAHRDAFGIDRPTWLLVLVGWDVLLQVVLLGSLSPSGLPFGAGLLAYILGLPLHAALIAQDAKYLRSEGIPWGRARYLYALSGIVFVIPLVYLFQRTEHTYYAAMGDLTADAGETTPLTKPRTILGSETTGSIHEES